MRATARTITRQSLGYCAAIVIAAALPFVCSTFVIQDIFGLAAWMTVVAMSIVFLYKYAGMVSFAQVGIYGLSSYTFAIAAVAHHFPWYVAVVAALAASTLCALFFGLLLARIYGIYFLMTTLALGLVVYYLTLSDYNLTHGSGGIAGVNPPAFGTVALYAPVPQYFLNVLVFLLVLAGLTTLMRTQFGLALQGCRDNPRRMRAMGYPVGAYRVIAFTIAGFVAGVGGLLGVWYNGVIAPPNMDLTWIVGFLAIAVIGGMDSMYGTLSGAIAYTLITTYASTFTNRYNTVIGLVFLAIIIFMPRGLGGLASSLSRKFREPLLTEGRVKPHLVTGEKDQSRGLSASALSAPRKDGSPDEI